MRETEGVFEIFFVLIKKKVCVCVFERGGERERERKRYTQRASHNLWVE